ncbi:MAG: MBL fold metallo-hydrolase [Odoribacteraceae bacterium]|jgi:glyoxylase-like metal-dependent hydrolase (beta-lactamase superfamily II)|nr:MBL fold metallo-hydrolase [Odoribacteraceae bacterium]
MKYLFTALLIAILAPGLLAREDKNTFTLTVGKWEVTLLSEGQQEGRAAILVGATPKMLELIPGGAFPNAINAFLARSGDMLVLIDTGLGNRLFDHLQALGVSPLEIDVVLLTHMHGDHIGGMFRDGQRAFPNARVYLSLQERDYWTRLPGNAARVIEAYREQLHLFEPTGAAEGGVPLLPGIRAISAFGHTPGHSTYLLESDGERGGRGGRYGERLLVWGDLTHAMAIQMPYPGVAVTYDVDPARAVTSREEILSFVSRERLLVAGMHVAYPGIGRIEEVSPGSYRFLPATHQE